MYITDNDDGWTQSNDFKRAFSINVEIEFVGVWSVFLIGVFHINLNILVLIAQMMSGIPLIQWD